MHLRSYLGATLRVALLAALLGCGLSATAQAGQAAGVSISLFNGKNLDGWRVTGCEAVVEDGLLVLKSGNGLVRSEHRYADFVLELDWRARNKEKWDSGIYFRCELPEGKRPWPRRYQANLLKGREGNVGNLEGAKSTGLTKPGDWNHFKLTVIGSKASMDINGTPAWKTDGIEAATGYIGLQAEVPGGGQFEFKNIRVTELGFAPLFNGRDLTGWEGAGRDAAACWKVEDGQLICTGEKGPWLRTKKQYGDFCLRLDYKVTPSGNSGVYVRVPESGAHHRKELGDDAAGVEVQILDDGAERYRKLKDYQYCGSVYAIAAATEHVGRKPGLWNSLEINCQGTHYRVTHNGVVIVDASEANFPELRRRKLKGFLGLQNHSEHVWFQNLRIGPPVK